MNIIVGHTNMDMDCIGSMVLARYLYPGYQLVRSRLIHPVARNLFNLYQNHLDMVTLKELKGVQVDTIVIVDTRTYRRVKEYLDVIERGTGDIIIYDHHQEKTGDIQGAVLHQIDVGSNTTFLALEVIHRGIHINETDATIALAGIYADTGNFTHENVKDQDFQAASYMLKHGASMKLVKSFLNALKDKHQITLFHDLLNRLYYADFNGHFIIMSYMELEQQAGGLGAVVEKVFDVENADAIFSVFAFKKENNVIIIGRSQKERINLNDILGKFDGGGHPNAASALLKGRSGPEVFRSLEEHLRTELLPAARAGQIMSTDLDVIHQDWDLLKASMVLESINHTGAPVVDKDNTLVGFMTLKDIMKGRKVNQMHAPVKAYMSRKVITGSEGATIREVADIMYKNHIGHLPIVRGDRLIGIVTRTDYLNHLDRKIALKV